MRVATTLPRMKVVALVGFGPEPERAALGPMRDRLERHPKIAALFRRSDTTSIEMAGVRAIRTTRGSDRS